MRILFITNNLPPIVDGVGDYTYNLAREFSRHGHKVHVICRAKEEVRDDYVDIHVAKIVKKWNRQAGKDIAAYIQENGIEVVSLQYVPHGFHPKGLPFGLVLALKEIKKTGVKVMTFCHEVCIGLWDRCSIKYFFTAILMQFITRMILNESDVVATSIEHYVRKIKLLIPKYKDVACIPIPSNVPPTSKSEAELVELRKSIAEDDQKIIGFFGARDCKTSIYAIKELQSEGLNLKMLFIGKVSDATAPFIPVDAYQTGLLDIKDIDQYLRICDIVVIPCKNGISYKNGSFVAAINAQKPIVTARGFMTESELENIEDIEFVLFNRAMDIKDGIKTSLNKPLPRSDIFLNLQKLCSWRTAYDEYDRILI